MEQQRRSRDQRTLVTHLTEQQKQRAAHSDQHRYSADRQRLAEQQSRTLAEQQRSLTLAEAQQRNLIEASRGAGGLTESQLRGLTVSGLTDMQALEHVARSLAESQQQADAARQQRMLHQELAAALAAHTQSPNQLQQVI